jgi:D-sedoheptulose 7-phosphate isomerase
MTTHLGTDAVDSTERESRAAFEAAAGNLLAACHGDYLKRIGEATAALVSAFGNGKKLLVYGNGGSASDAQHICGELVGRFLKERRGLPALALSANQSVLTAWGNDYSFETVFERQVQALGHPGDVAWGISTSGNSLNVIRGHRIAREMGLTTIGLTGLGGGQLAPWCDILLAAPVRETPRIQEVHLVTYHAICAAVEERLFGE